MARFNARTFMISVQREAGEYEPMHYEWRKVFSLLRLKDKNFLVEAYYTILKRSVDPVGMEGYLPLSGTLAGRLRIIFSLLCSSEQLWLPPEVHRVLLWLKKFAKFVLRRKN